MTPLAVADDVQIKGRPDDFVGEIRYPIPIETLRRLSQRNPWISCSHIALEWALIFAAIWTTAHFRNPFLYILTVIWIGARQHALAVLMHDGAHCLLVRDRRLNDAISEVLLAWPLFITMRAYRKTHWAHHRAPNTDQDPDWIRKQNEEWRFPKGWTDLGGILLKDLLALHTYQQLLEIQALAKAEGKEASRGWFNKVRLIFYALVLGGVLTAGWGMGFLLFWVVPAFTWLRVILRIRSIAEHFCFMEFQDNQDLTLARTTQPNFLERLFVAPQNIHYHLDHHLYPSVPFYRLPQLHALLTAHPTFRQRAHITKTYAGVLRECTRGSL